MSTERVEQGLGYGFAGDKGEPSISWWRIIAYASTQLLRVKVVAVSCVGFVVELY